MVAAITPSNELSPKNKKFLSYFPNTLFCYIPDFNKDGPVVHSEVLNLENQNHGYGTFFTVNGFTGGKRTNETLTNVNAFFVDIDFPHKMAKTDEAIREYKQDLLMELVNDELPIPTYIVETKNGFHVYWVLERPIYLNELNPEQQQELRIQYRNVEEAILKRYEGDPGAKDVARVLRVPGTIHQKDPQNPYEVKIVHYSDECIYTFGEIREKFLVPEAPAGWATSQGENPINDEVKKVIEERYPRLERPSYKKLFSKEAGSVPEGMRNKALVIAAQTAKELGWAIEKTLDYFNEFHGLGLREIRKTIRSAYEHDYDFGYNNEVMNQLVSKEERARLSEITSSVLAKTTKEERDFKNANQKEIYATYEYVIAGRFPHLKFKERGDFYDYRDGVYSMKQTDQVRSLFLNEMLKDGLTNYRKVSAVNDKIACLKSIDGRTFSHDEENPDANVLNLANCLLNIKTFETFAHTPNYLSTSQIPVIYNPEATAPRWEQFVSEVMDGDMEQVKLLQEIAGYSLTSNTNLAKAFIFYGSGANGKSIFMRLLGKLVGRDQTSSLSLTTITRQFGLTGLIGKRVNFIDEISGNYFESNVIKGLISGERMVAEVKYRPEPLEFVPTVKLVFSVNELPKINDSTPGLYRRFIIIPFERSFLQNPDLYLEEKLTEELSGILNWAIVGLRRLYENGHFNETPKNFEAMRLFKSDNSPLVEFISEHYQVVPPQDERNYAILLSDLYSQYRAYCFDHGYKAKSRANFSRELGHSTINDMQIKKVVDGKKIKIYGIRKSFDMQGQPVVYQDQYRTHPQ